MESEELLLTQLMKEIMSLERERKDLLHSLTPTLSHWKQLVHTCKPSQPQPAATTWTRENTSSVRKPAAYLDSILEDAEDLGHRMLSMAYVLDGSSGGRGAHMDASSLFKAEELVSTTSRLMHVSEEFYNKSKEEEKKRKDKEKRKAGKEKKKRTKEEELSNEFLDLCRNYLQFPYYYENELVLVVTYEQEKKKGDDKEMDKEKDENENEEEEEEDTSTMEFLKRTMAFYQDCFAAHHACWERIWGSEVGRCGGFQDTSK
jgi:cell division protein FtsB